VLEEHEDKSWSHVVAIAFAFDRQFEQRGLHVIPARRSDPFRMTAGGALRKRLLRV